jgi:hypothetical protein
MKQIGPEALIENQQPDFAHLQGEFGYMEK